MAHVSHRSESNLRPLRQMEHLSAPMITLFAFLVRIREFSILSTSVVIALSLVCVPTIALSLRSEFRRNR